MGGNERRANLGIDHLVNLGITSGRASQVDVALLITNNPSTDKTALVLFIYLLSLFIYLYIFIQYINYITEREILKKQGL